MEPTAPSAPDATPLVADRYERGDALDDFGLGDVWRATDTRFRGRAVALKLLRAIEGDALLADLAARFKSLRTLRHDQCLPVINSGITERRPFVVYEHFDGRSLGAHLDAWRARKERPPMAWVRAVFDGVLAAFEAAHALPDPVVHGAVSPASVLVSDDAAAPEVRVLDFGIGASVDPVNAPKRSARGARCTSPEQLAGTAPDAASDVFALALLLMEMLSEPPELGTTAALSLRYVGRLDTPDAVWSVVLQGTRQKPAERFATVTAMRAALDAAWETPDPPAEPAPAAPEALAAPATPAVPAPAPAVSAPAMPVPSTPLSVPLSGPLPALTPAAPTPSFDDHGDDDAPATLQVAVPAALLAAQGAAGFARTLSMDEFGGAPAPAPAFAATQVVDLDRRKLARMHSLSEVMTSYDLAVNLAPASTVIGAPPPAALAAARTTAPKPSAPAASTAPSPDAAPPWRTLAAALIIVTALAGAVMLTWAMHLRRRAPAQAATTPAAAISVGIAADGGTAP